MAGAKQGRQQSYAEFNVKDIKVFYWILVLDGKPYYIGYLDDSEACKKENSFFTPPEKQNNSRVAGTAPYRHRKV